jgi:hypothetical protein
MPGEEAAAAAAAAAMFARLAGVPKNPNELSLSHLSLGASSHGYSDQHEDHCTLLLRRRRLVCAG